MGKLKIELLGTSFTIAANEDTEYLEKLLDYYKSITENVSNIESVKTNLQNSILAGIMLCDELYKEKANVRALLEGKGIDYTSNSIDDNEILQKTNQMIDKINKVL